MHAETLTLVVDLEAAFAILKFALWTFLSFGAGFGLGKVF